MKKKQDLLHSPYVIIKFPSAVFLSFFLIVEKMVLMKFGLLFLIELANCMGTKSFWQLIFSATLGTHRLKGFKSISVTHRAMCEPCFHKEPG